MVQRVKMTEPQIEGRGPALIDLAGLTNGLTTLLMREQR